MSIFTALFFFLFVADFVWCGMLHLRLRRFSWRVAGNVVLFAFTALQVAGVLWMFYGHTVDLPTETLVSKMLVSLIYVWHLLVLLPLASLWSLRQIARGILWIGRRLSWMPPRKPHQMVNAEAGDTMSRRDFVATAVCTAPVLVALGATGFAAQQWSHFRVRRLIVPIPRLPSALDGLTIAQVCDLHVGVFTRGAILDEVVRATNQLQPDLALLPGDLINYSLRDLPAALKVVTRLQANHGVYLSEGNHDLLDNPAEFRAQTRAAGLRLLVNQSEALSIRGVLVQLLGLRWGARLGEPSSLSSRSDRAIAGSMEELLLLRSADAFPILLAHHPHAFDYAENIPLTLSGHTHGGQLMLTKQLGCGPAMFRYWTGLYQKDDRALVVSNGVGNWFPLRVQAPAEILHLTLRGI